MYNVVAFDLDGTLLNSEPINLKSLQKCLDIYYNISVSIDELLKFTGIPAKEIFEKYGISDYKTSQIKWIYEFDKIIDEVEVFDGLLDVIAELKNLGIKLAIVTSRKRHELDKLMSNFNLENYFDYTVSIDDTKNPKPSAEPLQKLMELANCTNKEILFIGDSSADIKCAENNGTKFGLALWGANPELKKHCKIILETPEDIYTTILNKKVCGCNKIFFCDLLEDAKAGKFKTYDELTEFVSDRTDC
ncbi:MAG: HAD family hydrolase, partial [Intestinibacter sp.]